MYDKPLYSSVGREKHKQSSRPMRELDFDHVTPFRPITRLNFWILKLLRGYPYKKIHNGVCHIWVGFVISGWDLSYVGGFVIYGRGLSYMGGICHPLGFVIFLAGFVKYGRDLSRDLSHKVVKNPKKCPYLTNPVTNPITFLSEG